jgi:hypothetical protein
LPKVVNEAIDTIQTEVVNEAFLTATDGIDLILQSLTDRFRSVETVINDVLNAMGMTPISINHLVDAASIGLDNLNLDIVPRIPLVPTDALAIPLDCCSIEQAMNPWINDRMQELRDVAFVLLMISIVLAGLPTLKLMAVFGHPWIPHKVNEFFTHPDWNTEADEVGDKDHTELKEDSPGHSPVKAPGESPSKLTPTKMETIPFVV